MKDFLISLCLLVIAVVAIGSLYLYGKQHFFSTPGGTPAGTAISGRPVPYIVLAQGAQSSVHGRTNYVVTSDAEYRLLWKMLDTSAIAPDVDFTKEDVIAFFAGDEPTDGYSIGVTSIADTASTRMLDIAITRPGASCTVAQSVTTPYELIEIPHTTLQLEHTDTDQVNNCKF